VWVQALDFAFAECSQRAQQCDEEPWGLLHRRKSEDGKGKKVIKNGRH
jgi:hypothetical protein